ncbi:alpha/beta fold hydrolase [Intrasporangium sp.]|uniref:alpha/beta hydrolase n=1 Tax=Intrasporangium sp. TaxID=1925024 RepID=UPI0033653225
MPSPADFTCSIVETPRLALNVWTSGPENGTPVLLIHGNLSTGGFWKYVAAELPDDVRVIAPDLRGFGLTDAEPIDATRGLADMVDDVRALLTTLGLAGTGKVNAVGWSMGAGVLEQYLLDHPGDLGSLTLIAPLSPYGFGGTKGEDGELCFPDGAGSGGGGANPEFVRRLAAKDRSADDPASSPRVVMMTYFGPAANAGNVDEEFLVDELLTTRTGEDFYPGDSKPSENWPTLAPGDRGILNTMTPTHFNASAIADLAPKPPITWLRGTEDKIVSDQSLFDLATLGALGAVPGWPGADVLPSQPMEAQMRSVLAAYAANGGKTKEVVLQGIAHGIPLEVPGRVAEEIVEILVR